MLINKPKKIWLDYSLIFERRKTKIKGKHVRTASQQEKSNPTTDTQTLDNHMPNHDIMPFIINYFHFHYFFHLLTNPTTKQNVKRTEDFQSEALYISKSLFKRMYSYSL